MQGNQVIPYRQSWRKQIILTYSKLASTGLETLTVSLMEYVCIGNESVGSFH